jgi:hypothetical protein
MKRPLARALTRLAPVVFLALVAPACGGSGGGNDGDAGTDATQHGDGSLPGDGGRVDTAPSDGPRGDSGTPVVPDGHPRVYLTPDQLTRLKGLLTGSNPAAVRFKGMVDNQLGGGDVYNFQAWFAALMYQLTGQTTYADWAIAQVDDWVTGEEALIGAGQKAEVAGDSYLYIGDHVGDLALTYDWCFDRLTADQKSRWLAYADQAVWNVWHPNDATWGGVSYPWSGWSIDNPSNNYYYSFLRATVLLGLAAYGELASAAGWVDLFRTTKIGGQLVPTFDADLVGGGSREGTGYGVSMAGLFRMYDQWDATTGERIADLSPHTLASLAWLMHATVPTLDRVVPVGDHARDSTAALFDYHRDYVQGLAWLFATEPQAAVAKSWLEQCSVPQMGSGFMFYSDLLYANPALVARPLSDLHTVYHAPGTGDVFARSSWAEDATYLHFKCGPYTESHAHQDQGSFLLYKREWLAADENLASHSGIQQGVRLHNLVRIDSGGNTVEMPYGTTSVLHALKDDPSFLYLACDATPAYDGDAAVTTAERQLIFLRPDTVVVFDRVRSSGSGVTKTWQMSTLRTPQVGTGTATLPGGATDLSLHVVEPAARTPGVVSWPSEDSDFSSGSRLEVDVTAGDDAFFLVVIDLDGAIASVSGAGGATTRGVQLSFTGGGSATLTFDTTTLGAQLHLVAADSTVLHDGALALEVDAPSVMAQ